MMLNFIARHVPGGRHILEAMPKVGPLGTLRVKTALQQRITNTPLVTEPYPYFVTDNLLSEDALAEFIEHWPQRADFVPEIAHTYVCETTSLRISNPEKRKYWRNVSRTLASELGAAVAVKFKPWIAARFGDNVDVEFARVTLMESDASYAGHGATPIIIMRPAGSALCFCISIRIPRAIPARQSCATPATASKRKPKWLHGHCDGKTNRRSPRSRQLNTGPTAFSRFSIPRSAITASPLPSRTQLAIVASSAFI